jgi:hypothetical protein
MRLKKRDFKFKICELSYFLPKITVIRPQFQKDSLPLHHDKILMVKVYG